MLRKPSLAQACSMPPKRSIKPAADDNDDIDKETQPRWDANDRNLLLYLLQLKRWLPKQHPQFNNFIRYGYIINSRQQTIVFDNDHKTQLQDGRMVAASFEAPCTAGLEDASSSEDEGGSLDSGALTHPPSARKPKSKPTTEASLTGESQSGASDGEFKVAARSLNSYDEEIMETILSTYLDEDTADDHREECGGSARQLLSYLHKIAKSISSTDDANIEARMDNMYKAGLETASLKEYNSFKSAYRAYNLARKVPKSDTQMANDHVQVVNRLGDNMESRLESKMDFLNAHGNLKRTVKAIRMVLSTQRPSSCCMAKPQAHISAATQRKVEMTRLPAATSRSRTSAWTRRSPGRQRTAAVQTRREALAAMASTGRRIATTPTRSTRSLRS